jgi:translocation and assembly module TamB
VADSSDNRDSFVLSRLRKFSFKKLLLIVLPVGLSVFMVAFVYWLLHTDSGAGWLWQRVESSAAVNVSSSRSYGNLTDGFVIQNLAIRTDGMDVFVGRAEIKTGPGWWPLSIQVRTLSLLDVLLVNHGTEYPGMDSNLGTDIRASLEALSLPLPLVVNQGWLTNLRYQDRDHPPVSLVTTLGFRAVLDDELSVEQLDIVAPNFEAEMNGQLLLQSPFKLTITANGWLELIQERAGAELTFPVTLECSGDLDHLLFSIAVPDQGLELDGELKSMINEPGWDISGVLDHVDWPLGDDGDVISLSDLKLSSHGHIDEWQVELDTQLGFGAVQNNRFTFTGIGSKTGIRISKAELVGPDMDSGVSGNLHWLPQVRVELGADIRQLDLSPWLTDWPAGEDLAGEFAFNWSGRDLVVSQGSLTLVGTDLAINLEAEIDMAANSVNALLDWNNLAWPPGDAEPNFVSPSGGLRVNGSLDQWITTGHMTLRLSDYPQGRFDIQGNGGRTSARISRLSGEVLGGSVNGDAGIDWEDGVIWEANIDGSNIDPEPLLPGWPGRLDTALSVSAQLQQERFNIDLKSLNGILRGVELNGHGGLVVDDNTMAFEQFELRTDQAILILDGTGTDPSGLLVKFNGILPSPLLQGASGSLKLEASYSNHADRAFLDVQMEGLDLGWNGIGIRALAVKSRESDTGSAVSSIHLNAAGLSWRDQSINELSLNLSPQDKEHRLTADMAGEKFALHTAMTLMPQAGTRIFDGPWSGLLDQVEMSLNQEHSFELLEPAAFGWSSEEVQMQPACLRNEGGAGLCLSGDYQAVGNWSMLADVSAVPVDYLRELFELDVHFDQLIEGRLEWHKIHDRPPSGRADFRITEGRIFEPGDESHLLESKEGKFGFVLANGNLESGEFDVEFPGAGFIDIDFNIRNIADEGAQVLDGRAVTQMNDIKLFGHLVWPGLDDIGGRFQSEIRLGGNLSDPLLGGGFKLSDGFVHYVPLGVRLEEIEFEGRLDKYDRGYITGEFKAGDGIGTVDGDFLFEDMDHLRVDLALSGDQLLLVNTDTLKVNSEIDLSFGLSPSRMDINGLIKVPSARLTPENIFLGGITDSEDLVIESYETGSANETKTSRPGSRVFGQLEVAFGDDVFVEVPGLETHIEGSVMYNWSGDPVPLANGYYTLKGTVDVYGPTLQISNGSISFPGIPADNPLLNIRAEREIFGNTQIGAAGVQVVGNLKRPKLEAYTVPMTNEDRAWTLLVTGSDFDQAQGVSGFDVGTYIAPKLYVSYGISLFEDENVVSARYDLKKGFGVKVTSGQRETGLDVSYTIEK